MLLPLILLAIIFIKPSYAYWAENINLSAAEVTTNITIGQWILEWQPNTNYEEGQIVSYNGNWYVALRDSPPRRPGEPGGWNFWAQEN